MKKMYSKALAVMCAVTMALPSTVYTNVYADGEVTNNQNPEEGGNEEAEVKYENGTHELSLGKFGVAGTHNAEIEVDENKVPVLDDKGNAKIDFSAQYGQVYFSLPEGIDPKRVTKIEFPDLESVAVKVQQTQGDDDNGCLVNYSNSLSFEEGTDFSVIVLMNMAEGAVSKNVGTIVITLTDAPNDTRVVTYKLSELDLALNGGAKIEDNEVTFTNSYQSVFFDFSSIFEDGMAPIKIDIKGDANTFNYKVMTEEQFENDKWGNGLAVSYGNPTIEFDDASAKYLIVMSGDTPDDPEAENKTYGSFAINSEVEFTLAPSYGVQMDIPDLRSVVATEEGLGEDAYVGCAVTGTETADEKVMQLATKHFNAVTLGNELKLDCMLGYNNASSKDVEFTYVNKNTFKACDEDDENAMKVPVLNYKNAEERLDMFLKWNEENPDKQIKVRGHVLVWHSQAPGWFFKKDYAGLFQDNTGAPELKTSDGVTEDKENGTYAEDATKEEMDRRQEWYIKTMLEHFTAPGSKYENLFYGWDVVNEAVSDNSGTYRNAKENSRWWNIYKDQSFITNAFVYANKYAPKSLKLYYNDYNETVATKVKGIVKLLEDVKATKGARIDGCGMQAHYGIDNPTMGQVEAAVRAYSAVVDEVMLTELDVKASSEYDGTKATRVAEYTKQAYFYKNLYDTLVKLDKEEGINVSGIVVWGTVDKYSWLNDSNNVGGAANGGAQCPLLFDSNYQAKPAYWAFVDADKLEPYIQNVFVVESADGSFDNANTYSFGNDKVTCEFSPIWDAKKLTVKALVKGKLADTDKVTLYYFDGETKKAEVAAKDMKAVEGGYEAVLTLDGAYAVGEAKLDVVVSVGEDKVAFNDVKLTQEESDQYYANANFRPFAEITKGTVKIDGEVDDAWKDAVTVPLTINLGSNVTAEAKLLWDEDNLYVKADVVDPVLNKDSANAYEQDSVEVFIDENNHKSDSYEEDDKQYRINYENTQSFSGDKCVADNVKSFAVVPKDGKGYSIEAAFKWTDIKAAEGSLIGLELQVNDADESGKRIGTLSWYDKSGMGWSAPSVFGTAKLVGEAKKADNKVDEKKTDSKTTVETKSVDGPKVGTKVEDKKFNYVVTKAGTTDGKTVGEVAVVASKNKKAKAVTVSASVTIDGVKYNVTEIKAKAFYANKKLTKVTIGKNVKKIGSKAFAKCTSLKTVIVKSKKLRTIGKSAFAGDKKLRSFKMKSNKKLKSVGKKAFKGVSKKCKFYVPKKLKKAYKKTLKKGGFKGKIK